MTASASPPAPFQTTFKPVANATATPTLSGTDGECPAYQVAPSVFVRHNLTGKQRQFILTAAHRIRGSDLRQARWAQVQGQIIVFVIPSGEDPDNYAVVTAEEPNHLDNSYWKPDHTNRLYVWDPRQTGVECRAFTVPPHFH